MEEIIAFDKELLLAINGSGSLFLDGLVKTLTTAATWIPLYCSLFYLVLHNNDAVKKIVFIVACAGLCVLFAGSIDDMLVKPMVARWRPTHDPEIGILVDTVNGYRGGNYGFFSAHASNTMSIAVFFALLIRSRALSLSLIAWSLVNCWTRMYLGVHYPGDIVCGLIWGTTVGILIYLFHQYVCRRWFGPSVFVSGKYTSSGYIISDIYVPIAVLLFTFIYAIIRASYYLYV